MDLGFLLPVGADPASVAHEADGLEQIQLDHEAVEAQDALLRLEQIQNEMMFDRGTQLVRHRGRAEET